MKRNLIKNGLTAGLLAMCLMSKVYATDNIKLINQKVLGSEENNFLVSMQQEYEEDNEKYKLKNYLKEETEENTKVVTAYKKDIINSNNKETIVNHFGENINFDDEEYSGSIPIKDYEIKTINNGKYEVIDEKKVNFSKYTRNDLDNIAKEKTINGITYYLINVDWDNDETEIIDGQEVPVNYKGSIVYQTVIQKDKPYSYEVSVTYEGIVNKKDPAFLYKLEYEKIADEPIAEEVVEENDNIATKIVISGLGIALIIIYLVGSKTVRVYTKTDNGYKLIKIVNINKKHNVIDLSNYNHKTNVNIYAIKTTKGFYKRNKNMLIQIKKDKILKNIYLNSSFKDFLLG